MSRERCHLTDHALLDSVPLRLGRSLIDRKLFLENVETDPDGTANQKAQEIQRGNTHALADLWTAADKGEHFGRWRLVLGVPRETYHDRPVITVLPVDRLQAKSQSEVTSLLQKERETGKHSWLTTDYVAASLRPLYLEGRLRTQADLSEHIREMDKAPLRQELRRKDQELNEALAEVGQLKEALSKVNQQGALGARERGVDEVTEPARQVTDVWQSRTVDSEYKNVGIEAQIVEVKAITPNIFLTYIDSNGKPKKVYDFGYKGLVQNVLQYLKAHEGQRAVFILTYKGDKVMRLASDTMMWPTYRALWVK
jgi:hypothetical protein